MRTTRRFTGIAAAFFLTGISFCPAKALAESRSSFNPIHVVHAVAAVYPGRSVASGTVILRITIGSSGVIQGIFVIRGIASLTEECERVVRKWTFRPAELDGVTVKSSTIAAFAFSESLSGGASWEAPSASGARAPFQPARILSAINADYPYGGLAWGSVILQINVGESGAIDHIEVLKGIPSLTEAAERAVRQWRFLPATIYGNAVSSPIIASFTFRMPPAFHTYR